MQSSLKTKKYFLLYYLFIFPMLFNNLKVLHFWTLDVSLTVSYEITLSRLTVILNVCLSVRPSLNFLKIGSLVFSNTVPDDS